VGSFNRPVGQGDYPLVERTVRRIGLIGIFKTISITRTGISIDF
jgi:hypothetical protein